MDSLDVDSLVTNVPLEETIKICINLLYNNEDVIESINKSEYKHLLSLASQEWYFIFNYALYRQTDGVTMGSPFGPTMANAFCYFMNSNCWSSSLKNLNQFFTENMFMTILFSSNQQNTSRNFGLF